MVYESDFYTTRRPYRASPSLSTYTVTRREIPWEKVPFVPRPSLVPDPVTAFGRRPSKVREQQEMEYNRRERARSEARAFIISPMERARIRPKTPRYYTVRDSPERARRTAEEQYSYSYNSGASSTSPYGSARLPPARSYTTSERTSRTSDAGPGASYSSNRESTSRSYGDGPGGYHSSYTSSTSGRLPGGTSYRHYSYRSEPSRQVRILPGLGKVHVVHSYDRIVPYVGHKRLTVVTSPPVTFRVRPSVLYREYDRIENKYRPITYGSYTNDYLNSESSVRIVYTRNPISGSYYYTDYYRPKGSTTTTTKYTYHWPPVPSTYPRLYSYLTYPYYYPYTYSYYPFWPTTRLYSYNSDYRSSYNYSNYYDYLADSLLYPSKYYRFSRMFDDETRLIRAQSAALLKRVSSPVPRAYRAMPLPYISSRYEDYPPVRWTNDNYINKMLISSPTSNYRSDYTTYSTEPVRKYFGQGHLACVTLVGEKAHLRRRNVYVYVEPESRHRPVMKDIELMSYYINRMKQDRAIRQKALPSIVALDPARPSRIFSVPKPLEDPISIEIAELREQRAARLAKIMDVTEEPAPPKPKAASAPSTDDKAKAATKKKKEDEEKAKAAEEKKAKANEAARREREAQAKKEEAARKAELARQEELAAIAAAEKAAEAERLAEIARQEEAAKQAAIENAIQAEEERARLEEGKRLADEAKAEEERQQLLRLEEIARQAEEEKEAELARQADELAELARQEAELAEQAKKEQEFAEQARKAAEAEELAKQQAELEELERKEKELGEQAKAEAELAEQARLDAEAAQVEAQAAQADADAAEEAPEEAAPEETIAEAAVIADNAEASDDQSDIPADVESPAEEE